MTVAAPPLAATTEPARATADVDPVPTGRRSDGPERPAAQDRSDAPAVAERLAPRFAARAADADRAGTWRAKLLAGTTAHDVSASMLEAAGTAATRRGSTLERRLSGDADNPVAGPTRR